MYKCFVVLTFLMVGVSPATAATWNVFNYAYNDRSVFFFDADTIINKGNSVTLWTKYVKNEKYPDEDGSYSTAQKVEYSCTNRTAQVLTSSIYDKEGKFIRAFTVPEKVREITPWTISEAILKAVCTPDFPKSKSREQYSPVEGNDIFRHSANFYKSEEGKDIDLAPK
jgi:hypothetical protein